MMKLLINFFLPFCFLLLGNYAYTGQHRAGIKLNNIFEKPAPASCSTPQQERVIGCSIPSPSAGKVHDKIKATEIEEDDELEFFRKYSGTSNGCITLFCTQALGSIHHFIKDRLPICKHLSYISSYKFLFHCVMRI
jgi:hypothetical protein